ncbi:MAG: hypothetical protein LBD41_03115 [Clostridiales Family XIII bacterium]|jgi:hypothetical protein|nr:hypothetical protein [Clostridiales Family XIII bacterium]
MKLFSEILSIKPFKYILREAKIDIIKKLPDTQINKEEKEEVIEFIKKYGDSKFTELNWNNPKKLKYEDFKNIIDPFKQNIKGSKTNIEVFKNKKLFYPLHEDKEAWYYLPLSHDACLAANNYRKNADQSNHPDKPWCIGWDGNDENWYSYTNEEYAFVLQIKKNPENNKDVKYMYQIGPNGVTYWDQDNLKSFVSKNEFINNNSEKIYELFFEKADTLISKFDKLSEEDKNLYEELSKIRGSSLDRVYVWNRYEFLRKIENYRKHNNFSDAELKLFNILKGKVYYLRFLEFIDDLVEFYTPKRLLLLKIRSDPNEDSGITFSVPGAIKFMQNSCEEIWGIKPIEYFDKLSKKDLEYFKNNKDAKTTLWDFAYNKEYYYKKWS